MQGKDPLASNAPAHVHVGIDVCKDWLDVFVHPVGLRLRLANDTSYGLAGFVFSGDLAAALTMAERIEAGSVWVNNIHRSSHHAPFGGIKRSGSGRELGRFGADEFVNKKLIRIG